MHERVARSALACLGAVDAAAPGGAVAGPPIIIAGHVPWADLMMLPHAPGDGRGAAAPLLRWGSSCVHAVAAAVFARRCRLLPRRRCRLWERLCRNMA